MLKPENYSDVQRAMEERLNIPQSSDIRQSIISATEKIVHNKTARFFENSDMSEAEKNNFRKLISDATAYEVCKSCGFKTEDMPELFSDNIYVDMADAISATVSGISSIIMKSIENNVRISDERIRNERENNNGNITAESYERTGADASSNNRGRTDSGIDPRRTNEVGRAETSGTAAINANNAHSRGSDGNQNTADENAGSIYNRTLRTDEVRISGTADAEAPGVSDREQAAERTPGTSAGERGNRVQEIYPQSGNAGRGMAESNRNGQLHSEEPIVQQLPNDSRGRTDESLDLHRTRGNGIIGKATFKYIRDKKYVKGNTDDMLKVAARLDAENISFSGRINDDTTTITVSGAELQNKVRQYLDEVQHSSNLRRFERKDSFTEKEAAVNAFYGGFTVYDANGKKAENEDDIGYEAYYDPTEYILSLTSDAYEEPYCFFNAMFEEYAVDDIVQTFEKAEEAFTYGREHLNMVNISDAEALVEMDKQKGNSPVGNVIPETPKESLLRIAFNEYNDFVNSITTTAEAVEKANEITIKQELLRYFGELEEVEAAAILGTSDKPLEMVYGEWVRNGYNSLSDDVSATLTGIVRKSENAEKEHQISEVGNVFELAENYEIVFSAAEFEDGTRHIFPGSITEEDVWNSDVWNEVRNRNVDYDNITDLNESLKVRITHCTYGRGNTLTPNQDMLDEINENFDEIRLNSQILSVEETYLYLYKDIDDVLSELEKAAQEQHQREPQVSDGFDNSNFLLPDNLSPIARSGGREFYQIDEAVKAIKLNDREWLDTFDAVVAMNKKGVNVNDIEMLNVHYVSADGSSGYKDITPEQYIVYRNHTEERPQQMKVALQHFKDRINNSRNHLHFADDAEKMADFKLLSKEEFLESYSYLSEAEYNATAEHLVNEKIKQYFETGLPNIIRRTHAHDEMEDLVKETATDQFNNTEYRNTIARKYIGSGTISFPDNFFDDVKKEFTSLGLDADNFSVKIICTVDNVTLENSNISVTHSWDDAVTACLTAAEDYSNGENDYVIKTISHFIEEEKIKKAIADKGDIHFNAGNDNYIIAYDKEAESYFLEVKRPHSTDYERLREIRIETSDNVYGEMIWNSGKITGFSKNYGTDLDIPRDEFIEWAVKNLASMPYIQNAHNDEAKFRHLVRDNLYTLLYEYATGSENFNDYSIADFEKFFNKYINDAAELESIIYVVHNDVNENVLRIEKAKEVAEKSDLPFSSRLIDGDEDFDPYVYDGTMSLEDVEKMHELIAEDKFEIYQIKSGEEYRDKRFTDYNSLSASPAIEDYDLVYSGSMSELGVSNLEEIYAKFNLNHPEGFTGHSLSVSDIVVLHNEGDKYYYVDSVGYKDVTEEIIMSLNRDEQGNLNLAARLYDYAKNNLTYEWQDETEGAEIDIAKLDESLKDAETRKRIISYLEESDFDGTESLINDIKALDEAKEREYSFLAPDTTVTVQQMNEYGYDWDGMLPLSAEKAKELYNQNVEIYKLYSDNTEGVVESIDELDDNVMFGVENNTWERYCFVNSIEYAELINDIINDDEIKSAFDDKNTFRSIIQKKVTEYAEAEETTLADYLNDTRNKYPDTYEQLQAIVAENAAQKLADDISMPPFNRLRAAHNFTAEQLQIINRLEMTVEANKYTSVSSDIMNNGAWQMQYGGFDRINNRIFNGTLPDIFDELNGYMNPGVIETEKFPSGELEQDEEEQTSLFNDAPGRISSDEINLSDFDDVVDEPISEKEIIGGITVTCEWSESNVFEGGKMYTVAEFDRLMAAADSEKTEGWENGIEEYGSAEAFEQMDKERYYKYLGYEKTRFTINFPNGTTISERQDIGDGFGGLISYCKTFPSLQQYVPLLEAQRDLDNLKSGYVEENKNSPMGNNFKITDDFSIDSGAKTRFRNNVEAIKLLNTIEAENRLATPDEQKILAKYVGWGGLSKAFDATDANWQREYNELKELLPESEYNSARGSVLNAHYTTATVINAIYQGLENLGFEGGRILEPAMGTGNFFGAMPQNMADNSQLVGVELDSLTGRIAKQLYQNADIQVTGFEKTKFADNSFDVAVGNVPFGAYKLMDKKYDKENFYIHDYFFAKALDKVKPGGVVAFVTSKGTLDKQNPEVRKYLAQRAELLGAIRLPNNAFKANAGTEVTTDIIFLQKRDRMIDIEPDWVHLGMTENGLAINKYFIDHPEMVLGTIVEGNKLYGNQSNETMCVPIEGADLGEQLAEAVKNIKGQITGERTVDEAEKEDERAVAATPGVGFYRYAVVDGNIYYRMNGDMMYPVDKPQQKDRTIAMVELRDTVHKLLDAEMDNANNRNATEISILRKTLNKQYDNFAEKYGRITSKVNKKAFENDNSYHLLASLEKYDSDNNYIGKADIFEKSTVKPRIVTEHVDTAADALILSVSEKAKVDFEYMQQLTDMDKDTLIQELGNKIYQIPNSDKWVTADEYLSGNIRKKLAEAKAAGMEVNIQALEMAMPPTIDAADIDAKLGAAWIKPEYVQQFIIELLDPPHNTRKKIDVVYSEYGDKWKIEGYKSNYYNSNVTEIYGIPEYNAYEIIEQTLNMKSVEVRKTLRDERGFPKLDKNGNEIRVIDAEKTAIVQSKQKEIKRKFAEWAFKDPDRRNDLVQTFNERFNSVRLREFDGSNLNFVGMNSEIKLRKHQVDAVARQLYNGNTLLAHEVGAGKTFEMIAAAMEGKRLGLHNKSMFAVPNHLTEQFATDFRKLYPNCNILVATKKDMDTQHRRDFMAKIATGDYDAVILGHSQFDRIHLSPELESEYIQDELEDLRNALNEAKANAAYGEKSFSVKQIELAIKSREQQLERTKAKIGDDNVISFERLGIDKLFVDESHAYKNLDIATKMTRVAGLGGKGSGRSLGLLMKCKYLNEKTDFKGITFASGTPVSNSMTELYTIMRYLEPQKMAEAGIRTFDNWASVFAETEQSNELKPECDGKFQTKTRISKYSCFEQLMTMYGEVADIKTAEMMKLPRPEATVEVIKAPATRAVLREMRKLSSRASEIRKGDVDPTVDNMLKLTLDGKKIGLDLRLMNPYAKDDPNSKVNLCVNKVMDIYKETTPTSGVQMIFCDLSTPKKENPNSYAIYKKDAFGDYQLAYTAGLKKIDTFESLKKKFSNGKSLPKDFDKDTFGKLDVDDVIVMHTTDENGNVTNTAQYITSENTLEIASDGLYEEIGVTPYVSADELTKQFCVYEDIKEKLIKNGVPEEEIAFIHDYDKPEDKQKLYNQMNEGKVRVMIGSTGKCGAGMNAQKKMIALHHLDVPARPSDIEQRNGRIQRQGNENENVRIFRYITDRTFDAYSYQILENKQKFISQIMSGEIRVKTCEDIDEKALDYAEVKALCAGNPMIKEKIDLETQVNELRILKAAFDRQKYDLQDKALRKLPQDISSTELTINAIQTDIQTLNTQTKAIDDEGKEYYPITFNGTTYSSKEDAGNALKACMLQAVDGKEVKCGTYRGFDISVVYDTFGNNFKAVIRGEKKYYCPLNADPNVHASGNIRRLDNALGNIEKVLEEQYSKLENLKTSLEIAKNSADEEFPQLAELHEKENRLAEVEQQLQLSEAVDTTINVDLYAQLTELFPTIMSKQDSYVKLEAGEAFDSLNVQWISEKEIAVSHTYEQNGDLMYDPEIVFQVDATQLTATAISYEQSNMGKYETYETLAEAADCNTFASEWFDNIEQQGYEPVEQKSFDEEIDREPVRDDNAR